MVLRSISYANFLCFPELTIAEISPRITLIVGKNNSGKSAVIKSILRLQYDITNYSPTRISFSAHEVIFQFTDTEDSRSSNRIFSFRDNAIHSPGGSTTGVYFPTEYSSCFIIPFLSTRNNMQYDEQVSLSQLSNVGLDYRNLPAQIDQLREPAHPQFKDFDDSCNKILGISLSTFASTHGKIPGLRVDGDTTIRIESMGSGVAQIAALIARLLTAKNKLFLIEEVENDLHPRALKQLLDLIAESAKLRSNQFVISTHSNIVVRHLGSLPDTGILNVSQKIVDGIPTSSITSVGNDVDSRQTLLAELGYELADFDVYSAWLFFEESSAERIVRDFLIPWFIPGLQGQIQTVAANGASGVEPQFNDFHRLFLFAHLGEIYFNKAWVFVDGDKTGIDVVSQLKDKYCPKWDENRFRHFNELNFEMYYPLQFHEEAKQAFVMNKREKKTAKKALLDKVIAWIAADQERAKVAFAESAAEVINLLKEIEATLFPK
ncbi:hypothetical protein CCB80_11270 [Armatimonadetes bacterium Uphvl-Ar1]|nr:hypothetical protein CCB80_11270 [Armatimonadetes bacterium Uphvl-Ar1]